MNGLYDIYEKIYFKGLDDRERIISRIQLNITFYVGSAAIIFYMIRMLDYSSDKYHLLTFTTFLSLSLLSLGISIKFTIKSISGGFDYKLLPKHEKMARYRSELIQYSQDVKRYNENGENKIPEPNIDEDIKNNLFMKLGECSDNNNKLNIDRLASVRRSMLYLWFALFFFVFSAVSFAINDLDISSPRKDTLIQDRDVVKQLEKLNEIIKSKKESKVITDKESADESPSDAIPDRMEERLPPTPPTFPEAQIATESYKPLKDEN